MTDDHVVDVGAVAHNFGAAGVAAFAYRCTCGAHGPKRVAANLTGKARNEALEQAREDGIQHRREANRRPTQSKRQVRAGVLNATKPPAGGNVVDLEAARRR